MRITEGMMVDNMMNNLQHNMERLSEYNEQLSSGKKFRFPSEAPIRSARSMDLSSQIGKSEQFEENVSQARAWIETSESALDDSNHVMQRARELTVQGANDTLTQSERENLALELEQLREELVGISEARHGDRYVFSGQRTGEKPFDENRNYQGDYKNINREINPGVDMDINVNGEEAFGKGIGALDDVISDLRGGNARVYTQQLPDKIGHLEGWDVMTEDAEEIDMTVTIDEGTEDEIDVSTEIDGNMTRRELVDAINDEIDGDKQHVRMRNGRIEFRSDSEGPDSNVNVNFDVEANNNGEGIEQDLEEAFFQDEPSEAAGGQGSIMLSEEDLSTFDDAIDDSLNLRAELGAKMNRLDLTKGRLEDEILNQRELLSENQDTDMAETIMELRMEESVYQASLATGARIIQPSLVDFLQ